MKKNNEIVSKNNELFYKDLFQNNLEIMLLIDPETSQIKDCNLSACKFYGYSYNEMLNYKITDINVLTQEQVRNEMQLAKKEKRNYFYFKHRIANGQIRDVEVKSSHIHLDGKELLFSIIKDTTDYKIYDQKLRIENSNLERIVAERTYDLEKESNTLKRLEKRWLISQKIAKVGILIFDPKRDKFWASEEFLRIYGINKKIESSSIEYLKSFQLAEYNQMLDEKIDDLIMKHQGYEAEYKITRENDSEERIIHVIGDVETEELDEDTSFIFVIQDITELKMSEEKIKESEEFYRTIFEKSPFGISLNDSLSRKTIEVNQKYADILKMSKEECSNIDWISITHPDDIQEDLENMKKMNTGEINSLTMQKRYIRPDNSIVWINMKIVPIINENYKSFRHLCMIEDITDRRNAYMSLEESELRFREVFENTTDCIFIVEKGNDGQLYYKGFNPAEEKSVGLKNSEIYGKCINDVLSPEVAALVSGKYWNCIESRSVLNYEETLNFLTGVKYFSTILIPVKNQDGQVYRIIGISNDITKQKVIEKELKYKYESQKLLLDISVNFANVIFEDIDNLINLTLKQIGKFDKADRSYVFFFSEEGSLMSNTHEWCNEGIQPEKTNLQNIPSESCPWWMSKLRNFETIIIPRVSEMPAEAHNEKEILQAQSIKSVLVIPVIFENILIGYMGFDSVKNEKNWTEDTSNMLKLIANIFGNSIHRKNKILAMLNQTVDALSTSLEIRDPYTSGHQKRVANIAVKIAEEMGLSEFQIQGISMASLLHDIGKVVVPSEILNKPGKLSELEFSLIKVHSQAGYDILKDIEFPWLVKEIVLQHHERINGSGYPKGLTGDKLLLEAKIIAVADAIEAMVSHRPYRAALSIDESFEELMKNKDILYDTEVVDCCIKVFKEEGFEIN